MKTDQPFVITLNRELGSGGRTLGRLLASRLGVRYYDKAVIEGLIRHFHIPVERIEKEKARPRNWWTQFVDTVVPAPTMDLADDFGLVSADKMFLVEQDILTEIAESESCVIAGRTGHFIFREHPNKLSLFVRASPEHRLQRVMERQGLSEEEARKAIERVDAGRENFTKRITGTSRYDLRSYDLVLNMDRLTEEDAAELVLDFIARSAR